MQKSVTGRSVGMRALFPCTLEQTELIIEETRAQLASEDVCDIANINSPAQVASITEFCLENVTYMCVYN